MYKNLIFVSVLLFIVVNISAQDRISCDLSIGVNQSIGKDIIKQFSDYNFGGEYYSRRKYQHPCITILINTKYPISKRLRVGVQSGMYIHFSEQYFLWLERTSIWIPLMATASYKTGEINRHPLGFEIAIGGVFFNIDEKLEQYTDGKVFNVSAFCDISQKSKLKFGIEKQIDNVSFSYTKYDPINIVPAVFNYKLKRLSLNLSYCFKLK